MKIAKIDRANAHLISRRVESALKALGDELGLSFACKGGTLGPTNFLMKIDAVVTSSDAEARRQREFGALAHYVGLTAADYGRVFVSRGTAYKIVGINLNAPKFPIECQRMSDGRAFKFTKRSIPPAPAAKVA